MVTSKSNTNKQNRYELEDCERLTIKAFRAATSDYELSDSSASAHLIIVPGFFEQYRNSKRCGGLSIKRKKGIELAIKFFIEKSPNISADEIWNEIKKDKWEPGDDMRWEVYIESVEYKGKYVERIFQRYSGSDCSKNNRPHKTSSISQGTFYSEYYLKLKN